MAFFCLEETMIQAKTLSKNFDKRRVVHDVTFLAADGAITGLLGPNGAGKTTTLRIIGGVLKPDSGIVETDDEPNSRDPLIRQRRMGALLDHRGIYARLTVRENLEYFGRLRGMTEAALQARIPEVVTILGLESIIHRQTAGFSEGERMKTALGRALLHSPQNLLLDEPTNGLDVPTVRALRVLLHRLREAGMCVLFSSHVLQEVQALCDTIVILSRGEIAGQGSTDDLCLKAGTTSLEDAFVKLTCGQEIIPC
jgi:sodium transport system ATP-binding protein